MQSADYTNDRIVESARKHNMPLMGGPMLGNLREDGVTLWMRPAKTNRLVVKVKKPSGGFKKSYRKRSIEPGVEQRIVLE